jgi:hypothetical protein
MCRNEQANKTRHISSGQNRTHILEESILLRKQAVNITEAENGEGEGEAAFCLSVPSKRMMRNVFTDVFNEGWVSFPR